MRCSPDRSLHLVMAGPWSVGIHQAGIGSGEIVIVRRDRTPYFGRGQQSFKIVLVIEMREYPAADCPIAADERTAAAVGLIFSRPQRLSRAARSGSRCDMTIDQG